MKGVPLRVRAYPKDAVATETRIVRGVPKRIAPERFQPPAGYQAGLGINVRSVRGRTFSVTSQSFGAMLSKRALSAALR